MKKYVHMCLCAYVLLVGGQASGAHEEVHSRTCGVEGGTRRALPVEGNATTEAGDPQGGSPRKYPQPQAEGTRAPVIVAAPRRIVALKPNITEILFAIGAGDRVVGVTTWCHFPPEATRVAKVADYLAPNLEKVLATHPDLVIGSRENSMRQPLQRLEKAGIRVVLLPFDTVAATLQSIRAIGTLVEMDTATTTLLIRMHQTLSTMHHALGLLPEPRVLILVGHAPFVAAGPSSFVGDLLDRTHAHNVVTTTAIGYPRLSIETILARNPQVIIDITTTTNGAPFDWTQHLPHVEAVRTQRIHSFPADLLRPGPRLVEGLRRLAGVIHERPLVATQDTL